MIFFGNVSVSVQLASRNENNDMINWQLNHPVDAVAFDCDGTLSKIEGIDHLAEQNQVGDFVSALTQQAMAQTGLTTELYQQRLDKVKPHRSQVISLGQQYYQQRSQDVMSTIAALKQLNKSIYILSAGVNPAVTIFASLLGVPMDHVFAVDLCFDDEGHYLDYDKTASTADQHGKLAIIQQLQQYHPNIAYVGDGMNDIEVRDHVARFIGYGGSFFRQNIAQQSPFYITCHSLLPVLALTITPDESIQLLAHQQSDYQHAVDSIHSGQVICQ